MGKQFRVIIIGSGPAGLSAAARAAERGVDHVVLESAPQISNTLFNYQKGKHVMAEPAVLPLRSGLSFVAASREAILGRWTEQAERIGVNLRCLAEVARVSGSRGSFSVTLKSGEVLAADHVVLSIGVQGNLRTVGCPGDNLPFIQYQLADPDAYAGETIFVIGAGAPRSRTRSHWRIKTRSASSTGATNSTGPSPPTMPRSWRRSTRAASSSSPIQKSPAQRPRRATDPEGCCFSKPKTAKYRFAATA
jgi:hypothetical protein